MTIDSVFDLEVNMGIQHLTIGGMKCSGCVASVETALKTVNGVESVEVSLEAHHATVNGDVDMAQLIAAVKDAGYEASAE